MTLSHPEAEALIGQAGLPEAIDPQRFGAIAQYFSLRADWSRAHNVAGPRAIADPWTTDLVDAVALLGVLHPDRPLVDVGTGSGTPGLLIACLQPERPILLIEPIAKRTAFLRQTAYKLGLKAVKTIRSRWPCEHPHDQVQVVSRAVIDPEIWPILARKGGDSVRDIIRMLALNRPQMALEGFTEVAALEYTIPASAPRRVERWTQDS
jgi:hypothetical protein